MKQWLSKENETKHQKRYHVITKRSCIIFMLLLSQQIGHHPPSVSALTQNTAPQKNYAQHFKTKIASSEAKCERRKRERQSVARELCPGCQRPPILCVCESLPEQKIITSTNVLVLQHPNEFKRKSLSTVPLMPLVLENCVVKVGYNFKPESLDLVQNCLESGKKPLLLFPGEDAITLDDEESSSKPQLTSDDNHLLILVDGTWAEATRILKQSPELVNECQQVQFKQEYESIYDVVRKEPQKHCISTLEACAESLICLEQNEDVGLQAKQSLERAMQYMVDIKRNIYEMRNPEPRFTRPGMKEAQRSEQAKEFEKNIFKQS